MISYFARAGAVWNVVLLNSFTTLILAILAGSVFIAAVVIIIWSAVDDLRKGDY